MSHRRSQPGKGVRTEAPPGQYLLTETPNRKQGLWLGLWSWLRLSLGLMLRLVMLVFPTLAVPVQGGFCP